MMRTSVVGAARAWIWRVAWTITFVLLLAGSNPQAQGPAEAVRRFTRAIEFDFFDWTLEALGLKLRQFSLGSSGYIQDEGRQELVLEYLDLVRQAQGLNAEVERIFSEPSIEDPVRASRAARRELEKVRARQDNLRLAVEAILQEQVAVVLDELGLSLGGAPFPPVSFHFARLPLALIVSPRHVILQEANILLEPGLVVDEQAALEASVEADSESSALVVSVGGLGTYPSMTLESSSIARVTEVVVHEWVHIYLVPRPLGWRYEESAEVRTMNETTASILGREIGRLILERYYPEHAPPPPRFDEATEPERGGGSAEAEPPSFDFRAEMRETRVTVDDLLAQGRIEEAEGYMEERRRLFVRNGFVIRRLNQAYFAFFGAYADQPGGAAGDDPVGAAVRELWRRIRSPAPFLRTMAQIDDFDELREVLDRTPPSLP